MKPEFARSFRGGDAAAVDALLRKAFDGPKEADLVRDLRASGEMAVELVLPWEGRIIAHVALSRMMAPQGWLCLAPLSVDAAWRGQGLGVRMAKGAVALAVGRTVVVRGRPSFFARAGFSGVRAAGLQSPHGVANLLIARPGDDVPEATLIHPAAFAGV